MNVMKPSQWLALFLIIAFALWAVYSHLQYFGNVSFLGGILLLEVIIACLWKYDERFFPLLMGAFVWAGMHVPMQDAWTGGRWLVLSAGTVVGYIIWMKAPREHFKFIHLVAFFCVGAAFVSASVSTYVQMASFKALSLMLLFLYCSSGIRLAVLGREDRFFKGLLLACEVVTFTTAICYFGLGQAIWGNPNALGAAMSIGVFPVLLWGWLNADGQVAKARRLAALLLCVYLIYYSMERAGIICMFVVTLVFCFCLHQYKLLIKVTGLLLLLIACAGVFAPANLDTRISNFTDSILYKGHKSEGVLGSRKTPWEQSISSIKEHPWFGTGYGTSPTGEDPGLYFGRFSSSEETVREHGSSFMTIAEWVGLLGALPFVLILSITIANVWRTSVWMRKTRNMRHFSIPLAMVLASGLIHANFEDWMFAVGAYPCVFFWACSFLLADLVPSLEPAVASPVKFAAPTQSFGVFVPNR